MAGIHCKDISYKEVDFPLTESGIAEGMKDWMIYRRSEYLVLKNGTDLAVLRQKLSDSDDLIKSLISFEIVSMPDDTVMIECKDVDVLNPCKMASIQREYPGKTVVVKGLFCHIGLVKDLTAEMLNVIDIVPPRPSKLHYFVEKAIDTGLIEQPVIPKYSDIDLESFAKEKAGELASRDVNRSGASNVVVDYDVAKKTYGTSDAGNVVLETTVIARATGKPDLLEV